MGAIGGLIGLGGGVSGTGIGAANAASISNPVTPTQIQNAYTWQQAAQGQQQDLLNALQAQNGLSNQNQVYGQLQGVASGAVNPAQAQFNQNTAANVANQAALMAGQRGASSNVGLMARQIGQNQGALQQQAVGQEASQQAQNQIAAIGQAGQLATTQVGQQIGQTNANVGTQQAEQANLLGAQGQFNQASAQSQQSVNQLTGTAMGNQAQAIFPRLADGGTVPSAQPAQKSYNNMIPGYNTYQAASNVYKGVSAFGKFLNNMISPTPPANPVPTPSPTVEQSGAPQDIESDEAGEVGAADAGTAAAAPDAVAEAAAFAAYGGDIGSKLKKGGHVPGKAKVKGNSYKNDNVKALLSPGEGVIDRETMQDPGPHGQAARALIAAINAKKGGK